MYKKKLLAFGVILIFSCFIYSCDVSFGAGVGVVYTNSRSFEQDLQGTWESSNTGGYYGVIKITSNTIRITGYNQTPWHASENQRPFKGVQKDFTLSGYSKNGRLFIENYYPDGLPYQINYCYPDKQLRFNFNGRDEVLFVK